MRNENHAAYNSTPPIKFLAVLEGWGNHAGKEAEEEEEEEGLFMKLFPDF